MSQFNAPTYDIARPTGQCAFSGRTLEPGEHYIAALIEVDANAPASGAGGAAAGEVVTPAAPAESNSATGAAASLGFKRLDISMEAWQQHPRPEKIFGFWRSTVPQPNQKKKLFVDDEVLMNLFRRLADTDQPQRLAFRFVLGLILMRKKLLRYDGAETRQGETPDGSPTQYWIVSARGDAEPMKLLNPQLDDTQVQQVTEQLGEVLEAEL